MNKPKTILVPTDFCVASLNALRLALEQIAEPRVNVVLLHCQVLDNSITELLFYSPSRIIDDLSTEDFRDALSILKNRFENRIGQLEIELFHGYSQRVFNSLLKTLKIDEIYFAKSYEQHLSGRAFDATPFILNGVIPYHEVAWPRQEHAFQKDKLENLFMN